MLTGEQGPAKALAMRVISRVAEAMDAPRLLSITGAHIDSCLHHGQAGLDFAARLAGDGAQVTVPTTLNVSSLDLIHPELYRGDEQHGVEARTLMSHYEAMGCEATWTCAPYQAGNRPGLGEHVAWAESNAIVFANSVLGARTHRYGDFIDICAAITGRAPAAGLHLDEHRRARVVIDVSKLPDRILDHPLLPPVLGHLLGPIAGVRVPVVVGAPPLTEDQLKALGSAAASSGSVALVHVVGSTPEAATLDDATGELSPDEIVTVTPADLRRAWDSLSTSTSSEIGAVSLGTPHYSIAEFARLLPLVEGRRVRAGVAFYVSTGRGVLTELELRNWVAPLEEFGVQIVTDTCTYITPVMAPLTAAVMTDSPKWAYYAPGNLGVDVAFGTVSDCVDSAVAGRVVRTDSPW